MDTPGQDDEELIQRNFDVVNLSIVQMHEKRPVRGQARERGFDALQ